MQSLYSLAGEVLTTGLPGKCLDARSDSPRHWISRVISWDTEAFFLVCEGCNTKPRATSKRKVQEVGEEGVVNPLNTQSFKVHNGRYEKSSAVLLFVIDCLFST